MKLSSLKVVGARQNNLKNITLEIPKKKLVVFTGVSGSGKSSLVFDTIYAEGHRKYVESLSSYARQFLARMQKPDVDYISGLSPAIAIQQRTASNNPRSTVGTLSEIYDYLKILFARIGKTYSPISGEEVKKDDVSSIVDTILSHPNGTTILILTPFIRPANKKNIKNQRKFEQELSITLQKGFSRVFHGGKVYFIEDILPNCKSFDYDNTYLLIDRLVLTDDERTEDFQYRLADSVQTAMAEGNGQCILRINEEMLHFSERFEKDGIKFEEPTPQMFNFNSPLGACPDCQGTGEAEGLDLKRVIPDENLSLSQDLVKVWTHPLTKHFQKDFIKNAKKYCAQFDPHKPFNQYSHEEKQFLLEGNEYLTGIYDSFEIIMNKNYELRMWGLKFFGKIECPFCQGTRIKKTASYVKVHGHTLQDLLRMPVEELLQTIKAIPFTEYERRVAQRLIHEILSRLEYLQEVGLDYLTLHRKANTLSGGEMQRIKLSTSLGSNLTGSLYILDEPSIGLHPRDSERLLGVLKKLRDLGNSVLVVEHDETIMRSADWIVDVGPLAGEHGGQIIYSKAPQEFLMNPQTLTAKYLAKQLVIPSNPNPKTPQHFIKLLGVTIHNIVNLDVAIPLNLFTVIAGVSGSGKTSLVKEVLYPILKRILANPDEPASNQFVEKVVIESSSLQSVDLVTQSALSTSSRSNPATYLGIFDYVREIFATRADIKHSLTAQHFSFNVEGGRCDACQGEGTIKVEMQFLPDVEMVCEVCNGKRYKNYVLDITYKGLNIYDVLQLTVQEAYEFFANHPKIKDKLQALIDVGLDYLRLGQSTTTLSGGEAQRLKLASAISEKQKNTLFIFDEPTTGLHFHDIQKLLTAFYKLLENQNTVIVIEHQLDVINAADWVIEMGPGGGKHGGKIVFQGTPEQLKQSHTETAIFLKKEHIPT